MGLFAPDQNAQSVLDNAPTRMRWTRELGTRKLLGSFVSLLVIWFVYGKIHDHFLLQTTWPPLKPQMNGLSVVGTLDARDNIERNMFRIVHLNESSRAELTDYGWRGIFDPSNGELFTDEVGSTIRSAITVDGVAGYAMLEPFLRSGVDRLLKKGAGTVIVSKETPIAYTETIGTALTNKQTTLGELLSKFAEHANGKGNDNEVQEAGSGSGREVEHGLAIPATVLENTCPVVLTGVHFTGGWLEEKPANLLEGKTYTVHLNLNDEGRSRFFQWSHDHLNESLVFVVNDKVCTAARIKQTLDVNDWEIGNMKDGDAAHALVDFANSKSKNR